MKDRETYKQKNMKDTEEEHTSRTENTLKRSKGERKRQKKRER